MILNFSSKITEKVAKERKFIDEVGMAAILHDVGKIILIRNKAEEYSKVYAEQALTSQPFFEIERNVLGVTHAEIGSYLMSVWGLPESIINAINYHHVPKNDHHSIFDATAAVYLANVFVHEVNGSKGIQEKLQLDERYVKALGLMADIPQWRAYTLELSEEAEGMEQLL